MTGNLPELELTSPVLDTELGLFKVEGASDHVRVARFGTVVLRSEQVQQTRENGVRYAGML